MAKVQAEHGSQARLGSIKALIQADGSLKRPVTVFRNFIEPGGKFAPENDRYHLYVAYACPFAHRTLIARKLKGLEDIIPISVVSPYLDLDKSWEFGTIEAFPGTTVDHLCNSANMKEIYLRADPEYPSRFSVPVLWDKKLETIVNNESAEIVRIFNSAFNSLLPPDFAEVDLYPEPLRGEIDEVNKWVYDTVNNGVYKTGVAQTQSAYETACTALFSSLDRLETMLKVKNYLLGEQLTEADVHLYVTIVRFDPVYVGHFKCNLGTIRADYPAINLWLRKLYWTNQAFKETTIFEDIKLHYYWSHPFANPTRVVPLGPKLFIEPL